MSAIGKQRLLTKTTSSETKSAALETPVWRVKAAQFYKRWFYKLDFLSDEGLALGVSAS